MCNTHREVVLGGSEDQVVCHDCRPGPPTEQLIPVQVDEAEPAEELTNAPTELLNPIRVEEHLAGRRAVASQSAGQFAASGPAPAEAPPLAAPLSDAGPTQVLPLDVSSAESPLGQLQAADDEPVTPVASRAEMPAPPRADPPRADPARADPARTETRRARAAVAPAAGAPHRRALRRRPEVPARGTLTDDVQGPLVVLAVLCAIVAIVGGIKHNSFLGLGGGLLSGAAIIAVIIIGLTSPKK